MISRLELSPHPEGGWFRETFRDTAPSAGRSNGTAIYFLLAAGERSAWHRIDAVEIWHHYAGAPLILSHAADGLSSTSGTLGPDVAAGQQPQIVVPRGTWQSARTLGAWTLVGCTVAPGFQFEGFEMAPEGFDPPSRAA
jgi:predicted cupin superfamily sugar epimerase